MRKKVGRVDLATGIMCRPLNKQFASPRFETDLPLCAPRCQFSALSFPSSGICCWTGRIMALFTPHYPINKWQCEAANGWGPKFDRIVYPFSEGKQCNVSESSLSNRVLIIDAGAKIVFSFRPDKARRFSQLPPHWPRTTVETLRCMRWARSSSGCRREEGGIKKRKKGKKKKPFVLTELEIAASVCEDCELRVRASQDHPPWHSMKLAKESEIGSGGERGEGWVKGAGAEETEAA